MMCTRCATLEAIDLVVDFIEVDEFYVSHRHVQGKGVFVPYH